MDAWNPDQLRRMELGGNGKLNAFLQQYGVAKHTDIRDKYNSKAAGALGCWVLQGAAGAASGQWGCRQRAGACEGRLRLPAGSRLPPGLPSAGALPWRPAPTSTSVPPLNGPRVLPREAAGGGGRPALHAAAAVGRQPRHAAPRLLCRLAAHRAGGLGRLGQRRRRPAQRQRVHACAAGGALQLLGPRALGTAALVLAPACAWRAVAWC